MDPLLAVVWWAPLAIIGGAAAGLTVGWLLLVAAGAPARPRRPATPSRLHYESTDKTNYAAWNPVAFLVAGATIALIVGLAVGLSVG